MGFFSDIQKWFEDGGENGGRYLQKIIVAWDNDDQRGFKKFISSELGVQLPSKYQLVKEYYYQPDRSADLAILHDAMPIVLVEIKWNDSLEKKMKAKQSQLGDYVTYCKQNKGCQLLVFTKNALTIDEQEMLGSLRGNGRHRYFGVLSPYLTSSSSAVAKLFFEYFQDKGVVMNDIDTQALFRFFHRIVNPYGGANKVTSKDQLTNGPEQFSNLQNNMRILAQDISPYFYAIKGLNRGATIDFYVNPTFSQKRLKAQLGEDQMAVDEIDLPDKAKIGGSIYVFAKERISNAPWIEVEYGFCFTIRPNKEHKLDTAIYALVKGKGIESSNYFFEKSGVSMLKMIGNRNKKSELIALFKEKISAAIQSTIDDEIVKDRDLHKNLVEIVRNWAK